MLFTNQPPAPDGQDTQPGSSPAKAPGYAPRIASLDVLRGIAVLGGLFVSIWVFGGFSTNRQSGLLLQSKGFDYRLFGAVDLLLEGKMRALIALVFGAGMLLFLSKDRPAGNVSNQDLFIRRQLWLILFGIINGVLLLWTQDVLFHLGIMGILLFPFARLQAKGLMIAALLTLFIYSAKNYWSFADDRKAYTKYLAVTALEKKYAKDSAARAQSKAGIKAVKKDTLTKLQQEDKQAWEGLVAGMKYDKKKDDGENKTMQTGSYGKIYNHLLPQTQAREARWTYTTGFWDFACMILLGMAIFKAGFFTHRLRQQHYLLLALGGVTAGLLLGWFRLHFHQITLQDYAKYIQGHWLPHTVFFPFERAVMAVGYAALVLWLLQAGLLKKLLKAFAFAGRMALTNYLLQSIFCTLLFAGFGMGYFGRLSQQQLYLIAAEVCLVQAVFSIVWLRYYSYGPAEWLWRCLVYKKWLPNHIGKPEVKETPIPLFS